MMADGDSPRVAAPAAPRSLSEDRPAAGFRPGVQKLRATVASTV